MPLRGYAEITFAAGTFSTDQAVRLSATSSAETARDWDTTAVMLDARAPYEVRINSGHAMPAKGFTVTLAVPAELLARMPAGDTAISFARFFEDGGEEILDSFESIPATYSAEGRKLTATLPANLFTERRAMAATVEAILIVGFRRSDPVGSTPYKRYASSRQSSWRRTGGGWTALVLHSARAAHLATSSHLPNAG